MKSLAIFPNCEAGQVTYEEIPDEWADTLVEVLDKIACREGVEDVLAEGAA